MLSISLRGGVEGIVGVFLADIIPAQEGVDEMLWVVTGDLPPAYLVLDNAPNAPDALEGYIEEMSRWVAAARTGRPVDDLIPVNVPPTQEFAEMLAGRLQVLREHVVPLLREA